MAPTCRYFPRILNFARAARHEAGVAIVLVVFIVALASIIVVNLAYSTYMGARLNLAAQRSLQAEYLLKSALNLASLLIYLDKTPEDMPDDSWMLFKNGTSIPVEWLGIKEPNLKVMLEVSPEGSRLPINEVANQNWRETFRRLFDELKFDEVKEKMTSGPFKGKEFSSAELVANLIDYIDRDNESSQGDYKGIEADIPDGKLYFPGKKLRRPEELLNVPGFTPGKVQLLIPNITTEEGMVKVNINSASDQVLCALGFTDGEVQQIKDYRASKAGPFKDGDLSSALNDMGIDYPTFSLRINAGTNLFHVVAKVDYDTSTYFLRATAQKEEGSLPVVKSMELF